MAFAFGLSAEIERNLISQRTEEALARKKAEDVVLGRPKGRKSSKVKFSGKEAIIKDLLEQVQMESGILLGDEPPRTYFIDNFLLSAGRIKECYCIPEAESRPLPPALSALFNFCGLPLPA